VVNVKKNTSDQYCG